ncbi:MAG: pirin family protein [Candidatus Moranbacteria bacterium]|nr:pirin family protein [Candidatus Moranbacteria bacterium]MDD3964920.1 pirin family protein [Candidatus Moranbacteria bacterium]
MRKIQKIFITQPTIEGAGVYLKRGFSNREAELFDPFLLFDDFSNIDSNLYKNGFPLHPHRGIETVTYILKGAVAHRDSLGSEGTIGAGDVQWMTAGSGIMHEEMPVAHTEGIQGFQLWVNLPRANKMMNPRYQEIKSNDIPTFNENGTEVKIIAGQYRDIQGPVKDLMVSTTYLDVTLSPLMSFSLMTHPEDNFFVYVIHGRLMVSDDRGEIWVEEGSIGLLSYDTQFSCTAGKEGVRFLLIGGKPIREEMIGHGPIVMNTREEIETALTELNSGTFIK